VEGGSDLAVGRQLRLRLRPTRPPRRRLRLRPPLPKRNATASPPPRTARRKEEEEVRPMGSEEEVRTARRRDGSYRRLDIASIAGTEWWRGVAGSRGRSGGGAMGSRLN